MLETASVQISTLTLSNCEYGPSAYSPSKLLCLNEVICLQLMLFNSLYVLKSFTNVMRQLPQLFLCRASLCNAITHSYR